jgi:hypothetical protein
MFFILLLAASAIAIAGSAAFFSVYGLANTFSGVFWSVVVMGASLEAGKLVAASYLYRYWTVTNAWLKTYLMAGVLALMILTSGGIFGYLSSGYQTDVLPLKQIETQVQLLDEEKQRMLDRKREIDKQITQMPENFITARIRLMREFQEEQKAVTERIKALDNETLELKKQLIKIEAHIGPITYIAKAFDLNTDDATKWLVFLIIFAFDPMAVALTLAVNVAIRRREEEMNAQRLASSRATAEATARQPEPQVKIVEKEVIKEVPVERIVYVKDEPAPEQPEPAPALSAKQALDEQLQREIKVYPELWRTWEGGASAEEKIEQLLSHYKHLSEKRAAGEPLTKDEASELRSITELLKRRGLDVYLT